MTLIAVFFHVSIATTDDIWQPIVDHQQLYYLVLRCFDVFFSTGLRLKWHQSGESHNAKDLTTISNITHM